MWTLLQAAGWPVVFLLVLSVAALALMLERSWSLQRRLVVPPKLTETLLRDFAQHRADQAFLDKLARSSPLGRVLSGTLATAQLNHQQAKEAVEDIGRHVAHELERFTSTLGTIATVAPLFGLFGTVVGMIEIFGSQSSVHGNPQQLAYGISVALYNTAFGLLIAIPSLMSYRYFRGKTERLVLEMEKDALKVLEKMALKKN